MDERFAYDKNGELAYAMRRQSPLGLVETFHEFDEMGRPVKSSLTQASVEGVLSTIVSKTEYAPGNRTVTTWDPASEGSTATAKTIVEMDGLGRTSLQTRVSVDGSLKESVRFGYDERGLPSYQSDGVRTASQIERDAFGRETKTIRSDGTSATKTWNAWGELTAATESTAPGEGGATDVIAHTVWDYSAQGTLLRTFERQRALFRATENKWHDDVVTTEVRTGVAASPGSGFADQSMLRAVETTRDTAGRVTTTRAGGYLGSDGSLDNGIVFAKSTVTAFSGAVPLATEWSERTAGVSYKSSIEPDGLGRPRSALEAGGAYRAALNYDESGNVLGLTAPGMAEAGATYDSRGLVVARTAPDGTVSRSTYDALGNLRKNTDESGEATEYDTDALGRVTAIRFADGTHEETRYENVTGAILATRDRAGLWLSYRYDNGGRVESVHLGEDPADAPIAVRYTYDGGGRVIRIANADAAIEFGNYDELGNPALTRSVRYSGSTGLGAAPVASDTHTQGHVWNVFGERTRWRMPAAGSALPTGSDQAPDVGGSWFTWIDEERDAAGNVRVRRNAPGATGAVGTVLEDTIWRGAGRLDSRKLFKGNGAGLLTSYFEYADGGTAAGDVKGPASGLLGAMETQNADALLVAGSSTTRDGAKRLATAQDLGMSRRSSSWTYDDRGRLVTAMLLTLEEGVGQPVTTETLSEADFRELRDAAPGRLTEPQRTLLGLHALAVEPSTKGFTEIAGHRIDGVTERLGTIAAPERDFAWSGGRRLSDGRWSSSYDSFGRVVRVESDDRRIDYVYDPNGRIVGRSAQRRSGEAWITEDRGGVLGNDGLLASTTWVWDPVTDRLVAIWEEGRSIGANDAQAGLLRQYLHGDAAYDDPVLAKVALIAGTTPATFAPIVDHAATGSLHAAVDGSGALVERVLYADAYGDAPKYLSGGVVDRIGVEVTKDGAGAVTAVKLELHLTEAVREDSLAEGVALFAANGGETTVLSATPTLEDAATIVWALSSAQWQSLATGATSIRFDVKDKLRCVGWGDVPVMMAPEWASRVYSVAGSGATPVSFSAAISSIASFIENAPAGRSSDPTTLYAIPDLYLAANRESKTKLLTRFKAAPFVEPATGLVYLRNRWYDPSTGTLLTPDPMGYHDSSNLYAFAKNDPVNNSDPTGEYSATAIGGAAGFTWGVIQMLVAGARDALEGDVHGYSYYLSIWGQNTLGGVELGASIDVGLASFGGATALSGALGASGFDALTFAGRPQSWDDFGENQATNAVMGAAFAQGITWGARGVNWAYRAIPGVSTAGDALAKPAMNIVKRWVSRIGTGPNSILPTRVQTAMSRFEAGTLDETGVLGPLSRWHNRMQLQYRWSTPPWVRPLGVRNVMASEYKLVRTNVELHHWLIPQRAGLVPNYIKNRAWNVVRAENRQAHALIDPFARAAGVRPFPLLVRPFAAMPPWARGVLGSSVGLDDVGTAMRGEYHE